VSRSDRPRHVIWITTDHMRYDCVGASGNAAVRTPHLDRLAADGVLLERCYGQNPLCMPSRVSFMTGQYPCRTGVLCNGQELAPGRGPTCAEVFAAAGYETAQIGKLHFQCHDEMDLDPRPRHAYGFHFTALSEEPGCYEDAYVRWLRAHHPDHERTMRVPRPDERMRRGGSFSGWTVDAPPEASHAGFVASQTIQYLRYGRPSFIHMGIYAPHPPLNPPEDIYALYRDAEVPAPHWRESEDRDKPEPLRSMLRRHADVPAERFRERRRFFYAMCTLLDGQVGRVVAELERRGELDDTLIVFMSDHGDMDGDHRMVSKQPSFYEEVMRLPVILHWPAGLPAGRRVADLAEAVDLLPTLAGLTGARPDDRFQGRNLAGLLRGETQSPVREHALAMHAPPGGSIIAMLRTTGLKYIRYGADAEVLYDLSADPGEHVNCAGDTGYADRLSDVRDALLERMLDAASSGEPRHRPF